MSSSAHSPREYALQLWQRCQPLAPLATPAGQLALHALAHLALLPRDGALLLECRRPLLPLLRGERRAKPAADVASVGGPASALLLWRGELPEASLALRQQVEALLAQATRDRYHLIGDPADGGNERIALDTAATLTPLLLYTGLACGVSEWVDEAIHQTLRRLELLRESGSGLIHQCLNFDRPGRLSDDFWSRSNGLALLALTELLAALPPDHTRAEECESAWYDLAEACLGLIGPDDLWHLDLCDHRTPAESSGTALLLFCLGTGLLRGWIGERYRPDILRVMRAWHSLCGPHGPIQQVSEVARCPGGGARDAYRNLAVVNDHPWGFGPAILALSISHRLNSTKPVL